MDVFFKSTKDRCFVLLGTHQWCPVPSDCSSVCFVWQKPFQNVSNFYILAGSPDCPVITKLDGCSAFQGGSVKPISVLPLSRESLKGAQCQSAIQYWYCSLGMHRLQDILTN